jgi:hypothetical protein
MGSFEPAAPNQWYESYIDLVLAVLQRIGCKQFTLCAWSMSGSDAIAYAAAQPHEWRSWFWWTSPDWAVRSWSAHRKSHLDQLPSGPSVAPRAGSTSPVLCATWSKRWISRH